jgi:predicted TPR repeat methyltransferase
VFKRIKHLTNYNLTPVMQDITDFLVDFSSGPIGKHHITVMDKFSKFDEDKLEEHYDEVALNYDGVYLRAGYPDPKKVAEYVGKQTQNKKAKIVDFGCGTGLIGKYLAEGGFEEITGLDASKGMLGQAKQKECYKRLEQLKLGQQDFVNTFPSEHRNKYDFVVAAGLINNNYLDEKIFNQMLIACKNHGFIVFAARYSYLGDYWYSTVLMNLEK